MSDLDRFIASVFDTLADNLRYASEFDADDLRPTRPDPAGYTEEDGTAFGDDLSACDNWGLSDATEAPETWGRGLLREGSGEVLADLALAALTVVDWKTVAAAIYPDLA